MATKKKRDEAVFKLPGKVKNLFNVLNMQNLNERTLQSKVNDVENFSPILEDLHVKYMTEEEDEDAKNAADEDFHAAVLRADEALNAAREKLDTLMAAQEPPAITPPQQKALTTERLNQITTKLIDRARKLEDNVDNLLTDQKPLYEAAINPADFLVIDMDRENRLKPVLDRLGSLETKIVMAHC